MVDVSVNFMGLELRNPFLLASGPYATNIGQLRKNAARISRGGWAGFCTKGMPRFDLGRGLLGTRRRPFYSFGAYEDGRIFAHNYIWPWPFEKSIYNYFSEETAKKDVKAAHDQDLIVIGNVPGPARGHIEEWLNSSRLAQDLGCDAIELVIGGPFDLEGPDTALTEELVRAVKKECSIPVMTKLNPHTYVADIASAAERGGADGISAINTLKGIIGIDIETGEPITPDVTGRFPLSGLSGPLIKPVGLYCVEQIARVVKIPICGMGGIMNWRNAVEYMMVGAQAVELCTAAEIHGFDFGLKLIEELKGFMDRKGYDRIEDFRGLSLKTIQKPIDESDIKWQRTEREFKLKPIPVVDASTCDGCSLCASACTAGTFNAITIQAGKAAVDRDACSGCGLCTVVCPLKCITLKDKAIW